MRPAKSDPLISIGLTSALYARLLKEKFLRRRHGQPVTIGDIIREAITAYAHTIKPGQDRQARESAHPSG